MYKEVFCLSLIPQYLKKYADKNSAISTVEDVINLNLLDSLKRAPYGKQLFKGILSDTTSIPSFQKKSSNYMKMV